MKIIPYTLLFFIICSATAVAQSFHELDLATYLGGSGVENLRDVTTDRDGNIYVTGGTASPDFPTTPGCYDSTFATDGTTLGSGGPMDVFVTKYSRSGQMLWSTLLGGPNYDRAYAIEVDDSGYVYVGGRAGDGFPTTPGVVQEAFGDDLNPNGLYGKQDAFVAKLSPDGSQLVWSTYFGADDMSFARDMDIDDAGNVFLAIAGASRPNPHVRGDAFQNMPAGGQDLMVAKLSPDADMVIWASYFGGTSDDGLGPSIRAYLNGPVYVLGMTASADLPVTTDAYDTSYNGGTGDLFVAKFAAGGRLMGATYLGGSGNEGLETHNLALDRLGQVYVSGFTTSTDLPTTPRVVSDTAPAKGNVPLFKLSSDLSTLLACSYLGGAENDASEGIAIDDAGNVLIGGTSSSSDLPFTQDAHQAFVIGPPDMFAVKLTGGFDSVLYASYVGGTASDAGRSAWMDPDGTFYIVGHSASTDFPVLDAMQDTLAGDQDGVITRFLFNPEPDTAIIDFAITCMHTLEGEGLVNIPLRRTGRLSGDVSVDLSATGGTATHREDYVIADLPATFLDGETTSSVPVEILADTVAERTEWTTLRPAVRADQAAIEGPQNTMQLYIIDPANPETNVLQDPGFENDGAGWQRTTNGGRAIVSDMSHGGTWSQRMKLSDQFDRTVEQYVDVQPGRHYGATGWVRTDDIDPRVSISLVWYDADSTELSSREIGRLDTAAEDWLRLAGCGTSPEGAHYVSFRLYAPVEPDNAGNVWFDDLELVDLGETPLVVSVGTTGHADDAYLACEVFPNPASTQATLRFDLPCEAMVTVELFDVRGDRVMTTRPVSMTDGANHQINLDLAHLPAGRYTYRIFADGCNLHQPATGGLVITN